MWSGKQKTYCQNIVPPIKSQGRRDFASPSPQKKKKKKKVQSKTTNTQKVVTSEAYAYESCRPKFFVYIINRKHSSISS